VNDQMAAYLRNLCNIFDIPVSSTSVNPDIAVHVLSKMYLVPTIKSEDERTRVLNEIRANLAGIYDPYSVFAFKTAQLASMMIILPHWYDHTNEDTDVLVEQYRSISFATRSLGVIAVGTGGGAVVAGVVETSKTGSPVEGLKKTAGRLAGRGPAGEELQRRMGLKFGARFAARASGVLAVGSTVLYHRGIERMEEIKAVLMHRYQSGQMTDDQFRRVFSEIPNPEDIQKYWEM